MILIGICGGTASGKTTLSNKISEYLKKLNFSAYEISLDNYYNDLSDISFEERCNIPNPPLNNVVKGKSADDNEIIKEVLKLDQTRRNFLSHWDLGKKYDIIDFELGVKITAAGFPIYKGKGAKLQRALINFFWI